MKKRIAVWLTLALMCAAFTGCMRASSAKPKETETPAMPEDITLDENGVPQLMVYSLSEETNVQMDAETYIAGVLAGEMRNDWPEEALKAQAILARTFVMNFIATKSSMYDGADISTDVTEAQAYAPKLVNARVQAAVDETRGEVVSYRGQFANTWFHAHSGGMTETAPVGLDYRENPPYIQSVPSGESEDAPEEVKSWRVSFTADEVRRAASETGTDVGEIETVFIGETGQSGRADTLTVNGQPVKAANFRVRIGADRLKSTMITDINVENGKVTFSGRGYGHGVGMSQWGAYAMAKEGASAEDIISRYFKGVDIVKMWE